MLNLSLSADKIIQIGRSLFITNTVLATWVTMLVVFIFSLYATYSLKRGSNSYLIIGSKLIIKTFFKLINGVLGNEKLTWTVLPLIASLFLYITTANWLGLVPGFIGSFVIRTASGEIPIFRSINSDLNTTASMAIISILYIKFISLKFPKTKSYLSVGVSRTFRVVVSFFEELSELTRIISLSFRLTGNVFAGEVLMIVLGFFVPYFMPIPFMFLEFFIGVIQALIFSIIILMFVKW